MIIKGKRAACDAGSKQCRSLNYNQARWKKGKEREELSPLIAACGGMLWFGWPLSMFVIITYLPLTHYDSTLFFLLFNILLHVLLHIVSQGTLYSFCLPFMMS